MIFPRQKQLSQLFLFSTLLIYLPLAGQSGNVGIGTTTPATTLDVAGTVRTDSLLLPLGSQENYFLSSDSIGNATWKPILDPNDISFIPEPQPVGYATIYGMPEDFDVRGDYAYVIDSDVDSMTIYNVSNPGSVIKMGSVYTLNPVAIAVNDTMAYVIQNGSGSGSYDMQMLKIDITDPSNPSILHSTSNFWGLPSLFFTQFYDVKLSDSVLLVLAQSFGVYDVLLSVDLNLMNYFDSLNFSSVADPVQISTQDGRAYVLDSAQDSLYGIDISDPENLSIAWNHYTGVGPVAVLANGSYVYFTNDDLVNDSYLKILDVSDPNMPNEAGSLLIGDSSTAIAYLANHIYLTKDYDSTDLLLTIDVSDPTSPAIIDTFSLDGSPLDIETANDMIYLTSHSADSLNIYDPYHSPVPIGISYDGTIGMWESNWRHNYRDMSGWKVILSHIDDQVGIGTDFPQAALQVGEQGDSSVAIANAWTTFSDARYKEHLRPLENPTALLMQLRGLRYDWRNTGKEDIGCIAQEVETVLPEIVFTNEDGYKSIDYTRLSVVLLEAMKQQQQTIQDFEHRIEELEQKIAEISQ